MRRDTLLAAALAALCLAGGGRADVILTVESITLAEGTAGTVDVSIRSTTGADLLEAFGLEFRITTASGGELRFLNPQTGGHLSDGNYLFFNNSTSALAPPGSNVSTTTYADDTYIGGDTTLAGMVTVPVSDRLLARLELTPAAGAAAPQAGDTFLISLVSGPNTFFIADLSDPVEVPFTVTPGAVVITAVPEPWTLWLAGLGGVGVLIARRLRVLPSTGCAIW
jgi:hypothetical protein